MNHDVAHYSTTCQIHGRHIAAQLRRPKAQIIIIIAKYIFSYSLSANDV